MRILITNDDGIHSPGLNILADTLRTLGEVTVVAPDSEKSAVGHSITINNPLRVKEVKTYGKVFGYSVNGTPADCVKIAIGAIMNKRADILVSGINHGLNVGTNILYSGTVSGAMEGAILGIPSIAISAEVGKGTEDQAKEKEFFRFAALFVLKMAKFITEKGLPSRTFLNINFPFLPKFQIKGILITKQGETQFIDHFQKRFDPRNNIYYWLEGEDVEMEGGDGLDCIAIKKGFISITPLRCDLTNHEYLNELKTWGIFNMNESSLLKLGHINNE